MNKVFYELKFSGKLPSPAGVGMQILQLTQQEDCGLDEITKVVRSDPSLTGRILKVANTFTSSRTGGTAPTAPPLEEAVLRIGFASLRDLVLGFSLISNNPKATCRAFDYGAFWHISLGRAVSAQYLTELGGRGGGSESYVCGLLCGMGRLGLAASHPERYSRILESEGADDPETLVSMETREFGINHRELTDALLADWGFPQRLARAAATYQQVVSGDFAEPANLKVLRRTLQAADGVVAAITANLVTADALSDTLRNSLKELEIEDTQVANALTSIRTTWREWGALLNVAAPKPVARPTAVPAEPETAAKTVARKDGVAARPSPPPLEPSGSPGASVLLLESDDRIASGFEGWLRRAGHNVVRSKTVRDALSMAVTHAPQIVIAHGQTDDTEALELCKAMRSFEAGRMTFFLLATANSDSRRLLTAFDAGVDDYLLLPCAEGDGLLRLRAAQRVLQLRSRVAAQEKTLQQHLAELAVANRKLHRAAMTDELTQLPNRRFAEETMRDGWSEASKQDGDLSLIVGDIDHFKKVNDTHGHLVGDVVLASVARVFRQEVRSCDVACRLGGEEFLVICPNTDLVGARNCAERLRDKIANSAIEVSGKKHQVTISLGVATRRNGGAPAASIETLFKAADDAAYESKRAGRNRVSVGHTA